MNDIYLVQVEYHGITLVPLLYAEMVVPISKALEELSLLSPALPLVLTSAPQPLRQKAKYHKIITKSNLSS